MAWIESHDTLRDHPKTGRLMRLLGVDRWQTVGILHFVWWRALTYAEDGDLSRVDDAEVADWAAWPGDPVEFVAALTQAGFLDADRKIHDWYDFAGRWIARREANRERMKKARAPRVQDTSGARAGATGPNRTGPDLTGPDPSPQPPPHSEGGGAADAAVSSQADEPTSHALDDGATGGEPPETHVTSGAPSGPNQPRARRRRRDEPVHPVRYESQEELLVAQWSRFPPGGPSWAEYVTKRGFPELAGRAPPAANGAVP